MINETNPNWPRRDDGSLKSRDELTVAEIIGMKKPYLIKKPQTEVSSRFAPLGVELALLREGC